jgi:hypothetical protein
LASNSGQAAADIHLRLNIDLAAQRDANRLKKNLIVLPAIAVRQFPRMALGECDRQAHAAAIYINAAAKPGAFYLLGPSFDVTADGVASEAEAR